MKKLNPILLLGAAAIVVVLGLTGYKIVFAGRVTPGISIGTVNVTGLSEGDLTAVLTRYGAQLAEKEVAVALRGQEADLTLADLGFSLDVVATRQSIMQASSAWRWRPTLVRPDFVADDSILRKQIETQFQGIIQPPANASLILAPDNGLKLVAGVSGEGVDTLSLEQDIINHLYSNRPRLVPVNIISTPPAVQDHEVDRARSLAETLLAEGVNLQFEEKIFTMKPFTVRRLIEFVEQVDPQDPTNHILGLRLNPEELRAYLTNTIAPEIDQEAVNARFTLSEAAEFEIPRVEQFAAPQRGLTLDPDTTAQHIAQAVTVGNTRIPLKVDIEEPLVSEHADIEELGITTLLARGESDFAGSPNNRVHNIAVGASRYHGLLIPPGEEFSFNQYLGPVTGAAGFKPELVIKQNKTVPEFGGGLCQVSTTAFRAAIHSGLEITQRRNHSYAVQYYGTPGFDATIYPGYTDLRFLNNTPSHILVQTKVAGTKLMFDFWGTDDGRLVEVNGPAPYGRQPDGAVKATLTQKVMSTDGEPIIDETFHSNYKSPKLFPKQPSLSS